MPKVSYRKVRQPLGTPIYVGKETLQLYQHKFFIEFHKIEQNTKAVEKKISIQYGSLNHQKVKKMKIEKVEIKTENCKSVVEVRGMRRTYD